MASVNFRSIWLPLTLSVLWCAGIFGVYVNSAGEKDEGARGLAYTQAHAHAAQLQSVRGWNAAHGGVYVREGTYGAPNPWLPAEMRQLRTAEGGTLALMNPSYMSRQIAERVSAEADVRLRIAGLHPLRPENCADPWECAALDACAQGNQEVFALTGGDSPEYRLLMPLKAGEDCLRCHTERKTGDILGGISVRLDAAPFLSNADAQKRSLLLAYALTALAGAAAVGGITFNLNRRRMVAEAAAQAKSAFLANMSHDMRTPLSGMMGMNDVLARAGDEPTREKARRYLRSATQALLEMVTDITDHAAMDSGQICLTPHDFALRPALEECLALYAPAAKDKGVALTLDVAETLPQRLHGDAFRLRQAAGNLISNAVKFTQQGAVRVRVSGGPAGPDGAFPLTLSVQDSGCGIPAEERGRIFESFERGAAARSGAAGTGLGLSIVRDLARLMGGTVSVVCPPEGGSIFTLCVRLAVAQGEATPAERPAGLEQTTPAAQRSTQSANTAAARSAEAAQSATITQPATAATSATATRSAELAQSATTQPAEMRHCLRAAYLAEDHEAAPAAADAGALRRGGAPLRVLVAEDNPANSFYVEECLRRGGAAVRVARDGGAALELLRAQCWDVALLDWRMPVMDGLTLLEKIRAGEAGVPVNFPVVMCTATCGPREQALLAGLRPDAVLEKPVPFPLLRETLRRVCGLPEQAAARADAEQAVREQTARGQSASSGLPSADVPVVEGIVMNQTLGGADVPCSNADIRAQGEADSVDTTPPCAASEPCAVAIFDRAAALADMDGDAALLATMIAVFLEDLPVQLERLRQAVSAGDAAGCSRIGHALKNSAGSLHLGQLRAAALALEKAGCAAQAVEAVRGAARECVVLLRAQGEK